jgi:hypothetical protein
MAHQPDAIGRVLGSVFLPGNAGQGADMGQHVGRKRGLVAVRRPGKFEDAGFQAGSFGEAEGQGIALPALIALGGTQADVLQHAVGGEFGGFAGIDRDGGSCGSGGSREQV